MAKITMEGAGSGGGITGSGAAGQVAFFDSASSVSGSNDLYWNSLDGVLAINSFDPTLVGSKLEIQGDNSPGTVLFTVRTGQIWGGTTIATILERGLLQLTAFSPAGSNLNSVFIGNSGIGSSASTGSRNIAIGPIDLNARVPGGAITTGGNNVIMGAGAGSLLSDGSSNVSIGTSALTSAVSSNSSVAVGNQSLMFSTGSQNVAIGSTAGREVTSASLNTFIGDSAGRYRGASPSTNANQTCSQCVYLGADTRSTSDGGATNEIVIGYSAVGNGSNSVTLGHTTVTNTYLRGNVNLVDGANIIVGSTTGTKIGTSTTQKLALWDKTPIAQPTTAISGATISSPGAGNVIKTDDTFGGYTLAQVVKALINVGILQ